MQGFAEAHGLLQGISYWSRSIQETEHVDRTTQQKDNQQEIWNIL